MANSKIAIAAAVSIVLIAACVQAPEPAETTEPSASKPTAQRYVSSKQVSTDCTSDYIGQWTWDSQNGQAPKCLTCPK